MTGEQRASEDVQQAGSKVSGKRMASASEGADCAMSSTAGHWLLHSPTKDGTQNIICQDKDYRSSILTSLGRRNLLIMLAFHSMTASMTPPSAPEERERVLRLQANLAGGHSLLSAGQYREGVALAEKVGAEARAICARRAAGIQERALEAGKRDRGRLPMRSAKASF